MQDGYTDPLIGTVLADRYRIRALMSQGGFGKVYRAEHVTIGRPLAVKVLSVTGYGLDDDEPRRRFLSEARATSQIRHPNVIDIIDFGHTDSGLAFYVMELLAGEDLAAMLRRERSLPWSRLGPMLLQMCSALGAAHRLGIVHRDIKPANCFRIEVEDNPDFIKVLDFGIAKIYAPPPGMDVPRTATHTLMGTPAYMAPEFAAGTPADERSDIYALGVVMYELATGARPFGGVDFVNILYNHRYTEPVPPRSLAVDLPEAAERIILRALSKEPADRHQSMRELQDEVRRSLAVPTGALAALAPASTPHPAPPSAPSPPTDGPNATDTTLAAVLATTGLAERPLDPPNPKLSPDIRGVFDAEHPLDSPTRPNSRPRRGLLPVITALSAMTATAVLWFIFNRTAAVEDPAAPLSGPVVTATPTTTPPMDPPPESPGPSLPQVEPPTTTPTPTPAPVPATAPTRKPPVRSAERVTPIKKQPSGAAPVPAFNGAKAHDILARAVKAGAAKCYADHNAPAGFEFLITVTVTAEGGAKPRGSATSPLRRCLVGLVTDKLSLGATTTGGEFAYTFHSP